MAYISKINIELLKSAIKKPYYASENAVGIDLAAAVEKEIIIKKMNRLLVPTGIKIELPSNCEGQIRPRSGLSLKYGITVLNSPGTIDPDYRGEIKVLLVNFGEKSFKVLPGMRIAQLVIAKIVKAKLVYVKHLQTKSRRGEKGFGSSGLK